MNRVSVRLSCVLECCNCAGVLMWEIFTCGEMPYGRTKNADVIDSICHTNSRLPQPSRCPDCVYELMLTCWNVVSHSLIYFVLSSQTVLQSINILTYFFFILNQTCYQCNLLLASKAVVT